MPSFHCTGKVPHFFLFVNRRAAGADYAVRLSELKILFRSNKNVVSILRSEKIFCELLFVIIIQFIKYAVVFIFSYIIGRWITGRLAAGNFAAWWKENTDCKIYASEGEKRWIEDIDLQFRERPIPNFYHLAGKSAHVDIILKDGDTAQLEQDLQMRAIRTAGHSADCFSFLVGDVMFIGDAVPVKGDIPIFVDEAETRNSLKVISQILNVKTYYPAWDRTYDRETMESKLKSL